MTTRPYRLVTQSIGDIFLPAVLDSPTAPDRGETVSVSLELPRYDRDRIVTEDRTVSGLLTADDLIVTSEATLTVEPTGVVQVNRLEQNGTVDNNGRIIADDGSRETRLLEWTELAGTVRTVESLTHQPFFRTRINPSEHAIDRLVWGLEPPSDVRQQGVRGLWGLLESLTVDRDATLSRNRGEAELTVLAPFSAYSDVTDLAADLSL